MIELTPQDVGEFKALFRKETGKDITDAQAREYALNLLHLVALVIRPESLPADQ
ncbi:hypothetical protein HY285_00810 [Candidatus Peregrinibacteria bacterium]|nr:hypothetical protein [Candidatus Peregrinibacteria bacterium]MBI3816070.1 hypothetical protein [Candidatus Peregrinibacteria bacterium]